MISEKINLHTAPDFSLPGIDESGNQLDYTLEEFLFRGKLLVIYFYPKDDTPGCTLEACDFRDNIGELKKIATVVGVSADSIESHKKFQKKYGLPFPLLSDPDKKIIKAYKAFGKKNMYGRIIQGIMRSTFIVGQQGKILKQWHKISAKGHVAEVIDELKKMK